jgi:hypothetical protein
MSSWFSFFHFSDELQWEATAFADARTAIAAQWPVFSVIGDGPDSIRS